MKVRYVVRKLMLEGNVIKIRPFSNCNSGFPVSLWTVAHFLVEKVIVNTIKLQVGHYNLELFNVIILCQILLHCRVVFNVSGQLGQIAEQSLKRGKLKQWLKIF